MPATIPGKIIAGIRDIASVPVILGGLISNEDLLADVLKTGVAGVAVSAPELWKKKEDAQ